MRQHFAFAVALSAMVVVSGQARAQSTEPPSSEAILKRLDALDKRNAKLEQDNAALRERLRLIEERQQPRAAIVTPRPAAVIRERPPAAAMAMVPPPGAYKAPIAAPVPYSWAGFYVGGHFGGGLAQTKWNDLTPIDPLNAPTFTDTTPQDLQSHNAVGLLGGIQGGYNWQVANWVFGIEGQYSFADITGDHQNTFTGAVSESLGGGETLNVSETQVASLSTRVDGIGTIAGRIGFASDALDRTMFYIKGGAAYAHDRYTEVTNTAVHICTTQNNVSDCVFQGFSGSFSASQNRWGWMAGAGLEYGLTQDWSAKVEYDFLGFGTQNVNMPGTLCLFDGSQCGPVPKHTMAIEQNIQMLKFGLNYHFNPTALVAKY